jgi:hypothetical protein
LGHYVIFCSQYSSLRAKLKQHTLYQGEEKDDDVEQPNSSLTVMPAVSLVEGGESSYPLTGLFSCRKPAEFEAADKFAFEGGILAMHS